MPINVDGAAIEVQFGQGDIVMNTVRATNKDTAQAVPVGVPNVLVMIEGKKGPAGVHQDAPGGVESLQRVSDGYPGALLHFKNISDLATFKIVVDRMYHNWIRAEAKLGSQSSQDEIRRIEEEDTKDAECDHE